MGTRLQMLVLGLSLVASASAAPASGAGEPPRTTEAARRAELYPQASKYLTDFAALEPAFLAPQLEFPTGGVLPGWLEKLCPQLTGLPGEEGQFILARVSEIARAVGVRMASEHCSPNLHIYVTPQPVEFLRGMQSRHAFPANDPRERPYLIDQFIATPRPVMVWYNVGRAPGLRFSYPLNQVIVVVDQRQLQGVAREQLAAYIAIVGLAEIKLLAETKPAGHLGATSTILKLFDGAPQAAPSGLSDWDQAFLKALYSAPRTNPWHRELASVDQITLRMVSEIAP